MAKAEKRTRISIGEGAGITVIKGTKAVENLAIERVISRDAPSISDATLS